jgi:branched-chain amino acid transport system ATP-binding protein
VKCGRTPGSGRPTLAPKRDAALRGAPLLAVDELRVSFGRVEALKGVSLEVREGEIVALLGANGAGKTTLLETVLGIHTPDSGSIRFRGISIAGASADRNVRAGMSLVPEGRGVFASMSVLDNLLIGARNDMKGSGARLSRLFDWFPILKGRSMQLAGTLSGGERRMLAIGRALMSGPALVMVDEPSLGLAPKIVAEVFSILKRLNGEGYTILLAEQNANKALACASRAIVLETGTVALSGASDELRGDPGVRSAYLGA